ncbi:MAG: lactonase family protein [Bacteroidota bacterium]
MLKFIRFFGGCMMAMLFAFSCSGPGNKTDISEPIHFFVGSSDGKLEHSIFLCSLDPLSDEFVVLDSFAGAKSPSYLALSTGKEMVYTINDETADPASGHMSVSSFRMDPEDYSLSFLNSQSSEGAGPCHISCSNDEDHIFVANYSSGHCAAFPLAEDGSIAKASSVVIGTGSGPVESRQKGPHAHMVMPDPGDNFLLVPDLGTDKVGIYAFDKKSGRLTPNPDQAFLKLDPGSGPRHLVFHPGGEIVYVVNELSSTVTACSYDGEKGKLTILQTVSTVSDSHKGAKYPAAVRVHPEGSFLYASTRGEHSKITAFRIEEDGRIYRIQEEEVTHWPREFNLHPSGEFMLVAGERSGIIELYRIDGESGRFKKAETELVLPSPACIVYLN